MFEQFVSSIVIALFHQSELGNTERIKLRKLLDDYGLEYKESWLVLLFRDMTFRNHVEATNNIGSPLDQGLRISATGLRWAERVTNFADPAQYLIDYGLSIPLSNELPGGVSIASGRIYAGETRPPEDFGEDGDIFLTVAPTADSFVSLNHNSPDYQRILDSLDEVREAARGQNDTDPAERDRVVSSLVAAQSLWQSTELRLIQVKVGILLAAEDAVELLKETTKAVAAALLVDAIKAFIKSQCGIDLDDI